MLNPFLIVTLIFFTLWAFLLLLSEETRREQITMSIVGLVIAPGALLIAATDYWAGRTDTWLGVSALDLLFPFAMFGIAAVIYQVIFRRHQKAKRPLRRLIRHQKLNWLAHLMVMAGVWLMVALGLNSVFETNSIMAFICGGLLIGIYVIADRKDLLLNALVSGAIVALLTFVSEQIFFLRLFPEAGAAFWNFGNTLGWNLAGLPAEEILWAAVVGFTVGPLYEYVRENRLR